MKHDTDLQWFDLFRGVSAIVVLIGHLRALTFETITIGSTGLVSQFFYFITGFGHEAVVIFFVLSGFFIIRSIYESVLNNRWSAKEYLFNRLARLWIVLIPALLLTLVLDSIGLLTVPESLAYAGKIRFMEGVSPIGKLGLVTFLGNVFFLQNIAVPTYGSNSALWSLANEFWYYMLFPLIYFAVVKYYRNTIRAFLAIVATGAAIFLDKGILLYFFIWLAGGILYLLVQKKNTIFPAKWAALIFGLAFVVILVFIRKGINPIFFNDFSLAVSTTLLLAPLARVPLRQRFVQKVAKFLSDISYSVYVTHLSLVVLLSSLLFQVRLTWSYQNLFYYMVIMVMVLIYCWVVYFLFERNTPSIKKYLKLFGKRTIHA
ncbi:MAG: acyltransferase [Bacteroidetes bacterium]|nr:acyltransferase [Bacteroidota bacterium]MBI3481396.1 acyltransferase [Bacteroidota bacterium]